MLVIQCRVYVFLQKTAWTEINMHLPAEVFVYIWRKTDFGKHWGKVTGLFSLFFFLKTRAFSILLASWGVQFLLLFWSFAVIPLSSTSSSGGVRRGLGTAGSLQVWGMFEVGYHSDTSVARQQWEPERSDWFSNVVSYLRSETLFLRNGGMDVIKNIIYGLDCLLPEARLSKISKYLDSPAFKTKERWCELVLLSRWWWVCPFHRLAGQELSASGGFVDEKASGWD